MATDILSESESRGFSQFLDAVAVDAEIVGGVDLVIRRPGSGTTMGRGGGGGGGGGTGRPPAGRYGAHAELLPMHSQQQYQQQQQQQQGYAPGYSASRTLTSITPSSLGLLPNPPPLSHSTSSPYPSSYHHPTPAFAPPRQSYPISLSAPLPPSSASTRSDPSRFAAPAALDHFARGKKARMEQHTRELEDWMTAGERGVTERSGASPDSAGSAAGGFARGTGSRGKRDPQEDGESGLHSAGSAPERSRSVKEYPEERSRWVDEPDDTMTLMREAELRPGHHARMGNGGPANHACATRSGRNGFLEVSPLGGRELELHGEALSWAPPPPPVHSAYLAPVAQPEPVSRREPISHPEPIPQPEPTPVPSKKVAPKRKAPSSSARATTAPSTQATSLPPVDLNPAPRATPANIPPSPSSPGGTTSLASARVVPLRTIAPKPRVSPSASAVGSSSKLPLLSAAQKKANHIKSEQKRRAAIRAGYEGLCTVVPSLRAAVEEFEERVKKVSGGRNVGTAAGVKKRKGASGAAGGAGALMGGIEVGGEKVDGRAGPRSEAVVLGKSVDYLRGLLQRRQELLARLSGAYDVAQEARVVIKGNHRVWDEQWDEGEQAEAEPEADWSEDDR